MKLGIDFDDVLVDCNTSLALFHNARYGTSYERKDIRSWHLEQTWNCAREEAVRRVGEWYDSPEHASLIPMPGAVEAIAQLAKYHELHMITSRPSRVQELTLGLLEKHFRGRFASAHFTSHFDPGAGSKADVCKKLGISHLVEDSLVHARDAAESGITVLLLDSPWNREDVPKTAVRVSSWEDILEYVASIEMPAA